MDCLQCQIDLGGCHVHGSAAVLGKIAFVFLIQESCILIMRCGLIPHASRIPTSPQRATFMENEYGWFMCVYGMSFVSSEILKPEPRKHKKIKAQSSEVGTNNRPK